jgi:hypothetical protein
MRALTMALTIGLSGLTGVTNVGGAAGGSDEPRLDLRATPRIALPPATVLAVAELIGGEELEAYYCPELVWDWGDGSRSARESDCDPFGPESTLERRFLARHVYVRPGDYDVRLELVRAERVVAAARVVVLVQGSPGG